MKQADWDDGGATTAAADRAAATAAEDKLAMRSRVVLMSAMALVTIILLATSGPAAGQAEPAVASSSFELASATVRGDFNHPGVRGTWVFARESPSTLVTVNITITGLPSGTYATHIHTYGDIATGNTAADPAISTVATGNGVGSHFNPFNQPHDCFPVAARHVGDVANLDITGPESNVQLFSFTRDLLALGNGSLASIIGRGVILHAGRDNCGAEQPAGMSGSPVAQGVVGIVDPSIRGFTATNAAYQALAANPKSALGVFHSTTATTAVITGTVQFGWDSDSSKVRVIANVSGLVPGAACGFHVHTWGDDSTDGMPAGGHYNPANFSHALPPALPRHMGDMGSLQADAFGNGVLDTEFDLLQLIPTATSTANIIGRSVVLHANRDDGTGASGNAGTRIAVAVIGVSNRDMPPSVLGSSSSSTARKDASSSSSSGRSGATRSAGTPILSLLAAVLTATLLFAAQSW
jgi:Cu-Zn family superoxide dismutase